MTGLRARLRLVRERVGPLWWYTSLAFAVSRLGDVINVFIGTYLVPKLLPDAQLGALLPLLSVGAFFSLPLGILLIPAGKFLSVFVARGETGKARALLADSLAVSAVFTVIMGAYLLMGREALLVRLHLTDGRLIWPVMAFALLACVDPVLSSAARALKLFNPMLLGGLVGPCVRLAGMLLLLAPLGALGYLLAQLGVGLTGTVITAVAVSLAWRGMGARRPYLGHWREMLAYSLPLVAILVAGRIQGPVESIVIRHRLPPVDSAGYYYVFMFGNIPAMFSASVSPFLWPLVSDRFERGESTGHMLLQSVWGNMAAGGLVTLLFAAAMPWFFSLPCPWRAYAAYAPFVWQVSLMRTLRTSLDLFAAHESACRRFTYMRYVVPVMLIESLILYLLPAWELARPWLPAPAWAWVASHARPSLSLFVGIMLAASVAQVVGMAAEMLLRARRDRARPPAAA